MSEVDERSARNPPGSHFGRIDGVPLAFRVRLVLDRQPTSEHERKVAGHLQCPWIVEGADQDGGRLPQIAKSYVLTRAEIEGVVEMGEERGDADIG